MSHAAQLITEILHNALPLRRTKGSRLAISHRSVATAAKTGAVFIVNHKDQLQDARGLVVTSQEAILDHEGASHWTPNLFRYGTYSKAGAMIGHSEDNLKAINAFVVDADWPVDKRPDPLQLDESLFWIQLTDRYMLMPTAILATPRGYQAYYVLTNPVWMKKQEDGYMPALAAAKHVSEAIRTTIAERIPQVDTGANHFGFFRMPRAGNLVHYEPGLTTSFKMLLKWAKSEHSVSEVGAETRESVGYQAQTRTGWFKALTQAQIPCAEHSGYGRNNTLLTLCLAMYGSKQSLDECYYYADEWNTHQKQPLPVREVHSIVKSAYSGKYAGASTAYITELVAEYAPYAQGKLTANRWTKFAKPRAERQYSHLWEWGQDLLHLVESSEASERVKGHAFFTSAVLQDILGIKSQSLTRLLNKLAAQGVFSVRRVRGRAGGIYIATARMIAQYVKQSKKNAAALVPSNLVANVQRLLRVVSGISVQPQQFEFKAPPGPVARGF